MMIKIIKNFLNIPIKINRYIIIIFLIIDKNTININQANILLNEISVKCISKKYNVIITLVFYTNAQSNKQKEHLYCRITRTKITFTGFRSLRIRSGCLVTSDMNHQDERIIFDNIHWRDSYDLYNCMKIITMFGGLFSCLLAYSHVLRILRDRLQRL